MKGARAWIAATVAVWLAAPALAVNQTGAVGGVVYVRNARSAGAVIYLIPGTTVLPPPPPDHVLMDQRNLDFIPRILPILPGQAVEFRNSDPVLHNVFSPDTLGEAFNLGTYPQGELRTQTFRRLGAHVILCHVHPEMEAYVVVIPTRTYAVADSDGRFQIENAPPGTYPLHVWHRSAAPYQRTVTIAANDTLRIEIQLERRGSRRPRR